MTDDTPPPELVPPLWVRCGRVDEDRAAWLGGDFLAAPVIKPDGTEHYALIQISASEDENTRYQADCAEVAHEQLGRLPDEFVRRLRASPS